MSFVEFEGERQELQPQHLETFAAGCALAAVLKDAGNIEEPAEGKGVHGKIFGNNEKKDGTRENKTNAKQGKHEILPWEWAAAARH